MAMSMMAQWGFIMLQGLVEHKAINCINEP